MVKIYQWSAVSRNRSRSGLQRAALLSQVDCKKRGAKMKDDPDVIGVILQRPAILTRSRCLIDRS